MTTPVCIGCNRTPSQIEEYIEAAAEDGMSPDAYVRSEEGTYNPANGHFACTLCYVKMGMPSAPGPGWRAP